MQPYPDIHTLVDTLLGQEYTPDLDCWALTRYLFQHGRGITLDARFEHNRFAVLEVWWQDDDRIVETILQPWDVCVFNTGGPMADHVGIAMDAHYFVHSRQKTGVCKEPVQRWKKRLLQVVRVQERPGSGSF
jgi:cell wall-associated NlpC family hydrolase